MCKDDISKYRQIFINDKDEFLRVGYLNELEEIKTMAKEANAKLETLELVLLAAAENYFINGGSDFMLLEENVITFDNSTENEYLVDLFRINLMEYGQNKIDMFMTYASTVL